MKIISIIQARMNSNRLKGKVLLKINNKPIIDHLVSRLKKIKKIDEIIISTTNKKTDNVLVKHCIKKNYNYFRGSETNVLKRVYETAKKFNGKTILFITADCPIIDIKLTSKILNFYLKNKFKFDYVGNSFVRSFPDGMDVQVFSYETIKKNFKNVKSKIEKEHVTLGIKNNPKKFKIKNIIAPKKFFWPDLGLTLDEKQDFILLKKIINHFNKKNKSFFDLKDVINLLKNKKKKWIKINSHVIRKGDT